MKVTKEDIVEYRRMAKKAWHDKDWHAYMDTEKSMLIGMAESEKECGDTYKDVIARVEKIAQSIAIYA